MAHEHRRLRRVEFAETDAAGIVHFSAYFRYMEETEHEFLRSLGLSVHPSGGPVEPGGRIGFPRLAARCEFYRPLAFEDEVEILLRVARKGRTSILYQFILSARGEKAAIGEIAVASCRMLGDGRLERVSLPPDLAGRIEESPAARIRFRTETSDDRPPRQDH